MENTNVHTITVTINSTDEINIMGADNARYNPKFVMGGKTRFAQLETRFELKFDSRETSEVFWNKMASIVAKKAASESRDESTYIYDADVTIGDVLLWQQKAAQFDAAQDEPELELIPEGDPWNQPENPPF